MEERLISGLLLSESMGDAEGLWCEVEQKTKQTINKKNKQRKRKVENKEG